MALKEANLGYIKGVTQGTNLLVGGVQSAACEVC